MSEEFWVLRHKETSGKRQAYKPTRLTRTKLRQYGNNMKAITPDPEKRYLGAKGQAAGHKVTRSRALTQGHKGSQVTRAHPGKAMQLCMPP